MENKVYVIKIVDTDNDSCSHSKAQTRGLGLHVAWTVYAEIWSR